MTKRPRKGIENKLPGETNAQYRARRINESEREAMKDLKPKQPKKTLAGEVHGHKVYVQQYGLIQAYSIPSVKDDQIEHDRLLEIYLESRFS